MLRGGGIRDAIILLILVFVSCMTTNYTNVLDVYGGGGKLLGGTYLPIFFVGMLIAKYNLLHWIRRKSNLGICFLTGGTVIGWWIFMCQDMFALDGKIPFGSGVNPPSISLIIMSVIMLLFSCSVFTFLEKIDNQYINRCLAIAYAIGQSTLYIFIYHRLFLDYFLVPYVKFSNLWLKRCFYFTVMIAAPILIKNACIFISDLMNEMICESK